MKYPSRSSNVPAAALLTLSLFLPSASTWAQTAAPGADTSPGASRAPAIDPNDPALRRISDKLKCQCGGCTASVHTCPHQMDCGLRMYIRNTIQNGLAAGKTEDVIVAGIVTEYGPQILLEPPHEGFAWVGWLMPFVALLLGAAAVGLVLWRWKASAVTEPATPAVQQAPATAPQVADAGLVEKYRTRIDQELEKD